MITYNHERYIRQAIQSVLDQKSQFSYQLVIGEDCSKDNTRRIVWEYASRYPEAIRVVDRPRNLGMIPNLIDTLRHCRGKYVAFLEGDDYWLSPDKLEKQVSFMETHPECSMSCHKVRVLNEKSLGVQVVERPALPEGTYSLEDLIADYFVHLCSVVVVSGVVSDFPFWMKGDFHFCALHAQCGKIGYLDEVMAVYRIHSEGAWQRKTKIEQDLASIECYEILERYLDGSSRQEIRSAVKTFHQSLALEYRKLGEFSGAWKHTVCALSGIRPGLGATKDLVELAKIWSPTGIRNCVRKCFRIVSRN